jgi:hypothetical protein
MTPTLCQPCGRHKDRCRCAGRAEAFAEAAAIARGVEWWLHHQAGACEIHKRIAERIVLAGEAADCL